MRHLCLSLCLAGMLFGVPVPCSAQVKHYDRDSLIAAAREIIGMDHYCALITVDSSGQPHIRTMTPFLPEDDMTVWMATSRTSRKVKEIRNNPRVCLYYCNHSKPAGEVVLTGKAYVTQDSTEIHKRYRAYWDQAFSDKSLLMLIKVVPEKLEVLHYARKITNTHETLEMPSVELARPKTNG